jgi:drug/metabolite transporter (DMT)-like permease/copper chaperone CopZ
MVKDGMNAEAHGNLAAGIGLRLAATGLFAGMSLCVRLAALEAAPIGQIVFFRSAGALAPIILYLLWQGQFPAGLRTQRPGGHLKRSLYGCLAMFLSFIFLAHLPLAMATALGFLAPLIVIPFAVVFLGERPGRVVVAAALLGFAGIGLMLAPGLTAPELDRSTVIGVAAGLAMAVTTAAAKVEIKVLTATEPPGTIAFYFALVCALAGLASAPLGWAAAEGPALLFLLGAGLFGGGAHIAMTEAVARAPASTLAPFEYTAMPWALGLDLLVFGVLPQPVGLVGALVIVAAALLVAFADHLAPTVTPDRRWDRDGPLTLPLWESPRSETSTPQKERNDMCGCSTHQADNAARAVPTDVGTLTLRVDDMTCGHCAGTIRKAVEAGLPGTNVDADPASRIVSVRGSTDLAAITALIAEAGYTPILA